MHSLVSETLSTHTHQHDVMCGGNQRELKQTEALSEVKSNCKYNCTKHNQSP